ncbi:MAG: hypothetical protein CME59_22540 [Halioglobus sp.]|nr:hypothetical protein [Halioglobus sp.]|tara:strand:- start:4905 stop:5615 length:711 start_codon:yes stop_codon:yes gene_type:complete
MSEKFAGAIGAATQDKIFKDGTIRLKIDIEPAYAEMVTLGLRCRPDVPVIVAFLSDDEAREAAQERTIAQAEPDPAADYGQQARGLKLSAFFKRKDVWMSVGTDEEFLAWLRDQPCALAKEPHASLQAAGQCAGDVVAAHYRSVAAGAGIGIKPPYSAIPLCDRHHQLQHQQGYSALRPKEWWPRQVVRYVSDWAWEKLKTDLGYESWREVPPSVLQAWARTAGVERCLPYEYRPD